MNSEIISEVSSETSTGLGMLKDFNRGNMGQVLLVSLIAIVVVFAILALIIGICSCFSKGIEIADKKTKILPKPENALLDEDEDAVVASLVATIEYHKETKQNARLVSIKRID